MYQEDDEIGIVSLINLVSPSNKYNKRRWLWEYKNNPYGFLTVVAEDNGRIVGHMGLVLIDVKVGNKIIRGSQACDLCVHPDFRRQGMFLTIGKTLMRRASEKRVFFTYGFPNEPAYHGHLKYGWFDVARIPALVTYLDAYRAITEKYEKLRRIDTLTKKFSRFVDYFFSRKREHELPSIENLRITEASSFDERINEFWNRVSKNYSIIVVRNRNYLNWRYFGRPDLNYKVLLAEDDGHIEGYLVMSTQKSERGKVGYIVDVLSSSKDIFLNLIHTSIEYLSRQSVDSVRCLMTKDHIWYKALKENGFTSYLQQRLRFIARINSLHFLQQYKTAKEWYLTYGDSDMI